KLQFLFDCLLMEVVARQPAISFSISFQHHFNRAGGRTSNVLPKNFTFSPREEVPNQCIQQRHLESHRDDFLA
ncbi:MAG: hypothetical protein V4689_22935, partial [Verrucomicrobiota bacterium]